MLLYRIWEEEYWEYRSLRKPLVFRADIRDAEAVGIAAAAGVPFDPTQWWISATKTYEVLTALHPELQSPTLWIQVRTLAEKLIHGGIYAPSAWLAAADAVLAMQATGMSVVAIAAEIATLALEVLATVGIITLVVVLINPTWKQHGVRRWRYGRYGLGYFGDVWYAEEAGIMPDGRGVYIQCEHPPWEVDNSAHGVNFIGGVPNDKWKLRSLWRLEFRDGLTWHSRVYVSAKVDYFGPMTRLGGRAFCPKYFRGAPLGSDTRIHWRIDFAHQCLTPPYADEVLIP